MEKPVDSVEKNPVNPAFRGRFSTCSGGFDAEPAIRKRFIQRTAVLDGTGICFPQSGAQRVENGKSQRNGRRGKIEKRHPERRFSDGNAEENQRLAEKKACIFRKPMHDRQKKRQKTKREPLCQEKISKAGRELPEREKSAAEGKRFSAPVLQKRSIFQFPVLRNRRKQCTISS